MRNEVRKRRKGDQIALWSSLTASNNFDGNRNAANQKYIINTFVCVHTYVRMCENEFFFTKFYATIRLFIYLFIWMKIIWFIRCIQIQRIFEKAPNSIHTYITININRCKHTFQFHLNCGKWSLGDSSRAQQIRIEYNYF